MVGDVFVVGDVFKIEPGTVPIFNLRPVPFLNRAIPEGATLRISVVLAKQPSRGYN